MNIRRVVITGAGAITPLGNNVNDFWSNLVAGKSGAAPITRFDASKFKTRFACEVKGYDARNHFDVKEIRKMDLFAQYAMVAATEAVDDAGMELDKINKRRVGVIWGSGNGGFGALKALSTRNESPETASRPFDISRDGFVMGEGGVALVLEELDHAKARGAKIYAEVVGGGMSADAYHLTSTHPEGEGAYLGMLWALEEAGLRPSDVDYLNVHATSTPTGDESEAKAVVRLFGQNPEHLHISATKSATGHLLGAAGAIEALIATLAVKNNTIPATINTANVDPQIPNTLNLTLGSVVNKTVNVAMSNTFGFGGHNATLVVKKVN